MTIRKHILDKLSVNGLTVRASDAMMSPCLQGIANRQTDRPAGILCLASTLRAGLFFGNYIMDETWRSIPGHPGYEVSDQGRIRSFKRSTNPPMPIPHMRKPSTTRTGYLIVNLYTEGCRSWIAVHRAVLLAFVGPCPAGMEGCHGDGVRNHNQLANLRWDTPEANQADRRRHGRGQQGEAHPRAKLNRYQASEIRRIYATGQASQRKLAAMFGVHRSTIVYLLKGQTWRVQYADESVRPQQIS